LKYHPTYRAAFDTRLRALLQPVSGNPGPVPLPQASILTRFDQQAGDLRRTLECEVMRWGAIYLPSSWATQMVQIRSGNPVGAPNTPMLRTRGVVKTSARESRLLNDIPPPVITVTGNAATITRASGTGKLYFQKGSSIRDPLLFITGDPEYSPPEDATASPSLGATDKYVTARTYGPDLDGELAWSAMTVFEISTP
jgi:hypothetical protein